MHMHRKDHDTSAPSEAELIAHLTDTLADGLCGKMGMDILELRPDGGRITMPIEGNTQHMGLLHGGASIALAETIVSLAAVAHGIHLYGEGATAVGTTYSATHHRPGKSGLVTATAKAQHLGRQVCSYLVEITSEDGTLLCTVLGSAHILKPR